MSIKFYPPMYQIFSTFFYTTYYRMYWQKCKANFIPVFCDVLVCLLLNNYCKFLPIDSIISQETGNRKVSILLYLLPSNTTVLYCVHHVLQSLLWTIIWHSICIFKTQLYMQLIFGICDSTNFTILFQSHCSMKL